MTLLDELLAGRTLAVDRSALPSLAVTATMRADGVALEQLAQRTDLQPHDVAVQHVGSTAIVALTGLISDRLQLSEAANLARGLRHQRDLAARAVDQQQDVAHLGIGDRLSQRSVPSSRSLVLTPASGAYSAASSRDP